MTFSYLFIIKDNRPIKNSGMVFSYSLVGVSIIDRATYVQKDISSQLCVAVKLTLSG